MSLLYGLHSWEGNGEKDQQLSLKIYALLWSFSHASHRSRLRTFVIKIKWSTSCFDEVRPKSYQISVVRSLLCASTSSPCELFVYWWPGCQLKWIQWFICLDVITIIMVSFIAWCFDHATNVHILTKWSVQWMKLPYLIERGAEFYNIIPPFEAHTLEYHNGHCVVGGRLYRSGPAWKAL